MKRNAVLLTGIVFIPLLGLIASTAAFFKTAAFSAGALPGAFGTALGCAQNVVLRTPEACQLPQGFGWLTAASLSVIAASLLVIVLTRIVAPLLGMQRTVLSFGFRPYALLMTLAIAALSIAHFVIFGGALSLSLDHWFGIGSGFVLGFLGVVGLGAAFATLKGLWRFMHTPRSYIAARPISLYEYPRLGLMLRDVTKSLNTRMPDNIVIGLEATFFATTSLVHTPYMKPPLKGQTLHLSLPLMSLFTETELRAVLGHELGHFTGKDTAYSRRFAPVYRGLERASEIFDAKERPVTRFITFPAKLMIDDLMHAFATVERRIGRSRETRADKSGAQVSSPHDIAYSLLKSSVLSAAWRETMQSMVERGMTGRFSRNIVRNFIESVRLDVDRARLPALLQFALGDSVNHPHDTHPPTEDRLKALGVNLTEVCADEAVLDRFFNQRRVTEGLDSMQALEEDLTALQYHLMSELWPKEGESRDIDTIYQIVLADFLAYMVTVDGAVDDREIEAAERRAGEVFGNFDREGFRERCRNPEDIPQLDRMVSFANKLLTETGIENLKSVLRAIAEADGQMHEKETALMAMLEGSLVSEPPSEEP
jgi:Zn-dependent protease with chaperone function